MPQLRTIDADTLMSTPLPVTRFIVEGLLPEGLHILAGSPKIGKSWLALWICLKVSKGERVYMVFGAGLFFCSVLAQEKKASATGLDRFRRAWYRCWKDISSPVYFSSSAKRRLQKSNPLRAGCFSRMSFGRALSVSVNLRLICAQQPAAVISGGSLQWYTSHGAAPHGRRHEAARRTRGISAHPAAIRG